MVIPKQDTLLSIADRSLSRLRGSPLPGAGCWGPVTCVGAFILLYADVQVLSFASARLFCRVLLRRLCRRGALGWLCRLSLGGRLALVLRWRVCPAGCCCGGFAAGALLGWLCRLGLGWVLGRVDVLRIRRTSLLFFPLQTIAPSLRGLPAPAGWGSHNPRTAPFGITFSYIRQYWQSSGEILEYWNVRTDLSGKRACAQCAKMAALFCAVCPIT